jgi:secretion/DNA translocation related TadE-like protein
VTAGTDDLTAGSDRATARSDDVWATRRRMGETLRRWAGPVQTGPVQSGAPPPYPGPPAPPFKVSPGIGQRYASRLHLRRTKLRVHHDRGAATIFILAVGLALVLMGVAGAAVGAARVGRHQAQAAADLGALAGAARAVEGADAACERAGRFVSANGGLVTSCQVSGLEIIVRTEVAVTPLPGVTRHATAAARAGPVYAAGS